MNLVMADVMHCDVIEFTLPRTPLSSGVGYSSIEESMKAVFESFGLELIEYETAIRTHITETMRGIDANGAPVEHQRHRVHFRLMSKLWLRNLLG